MYGSKTRFRSLTGSPARDGGQDGATPSAGGLGQSGMGSHLPTGEAANYFDLRTGDVQIAYLDPVSDIEDALSKDDIETGLAAGHLIPVEPLPSSVEYGWMADFADSAAELRLQELLRVALNGRGAFRRFKDVLGDYPEERTRWFAFRDGCLREAMLEWLADHDLEPTAPPRSTNAT